MYQILIIKRVTQAQFIHPVYYKAVVGSGPHQVGKDGFDFRPTHFGRVVFVMQEDISFCPLNTGFFGAAGVLLQEDGIARIWSQVFSDFGVEIRNQMVICTIF